MSKHDKKTTTPTTTSTTTTTEEKMPESTPTAAPAATPTPPQTPDVPVSALVRAPESALQTGDDPKAWMNELSKGVKSLLESTEPVGDGELAAYVEQLPDAAQQAFSDMLDRMNPIKPGMVVAESRFEIPAAKLYHGVGDDPGRPASAPVGCVYTNEGRILVAFDKQNARNAGCKTTFEAAVLSIQETRSWWKPRNNPKFVLPPGVDADSKAPICTSHDRKRGGRFGDCVACPHRPYANGKYNDSGCADDYRLYFIMKDFSGIFEMTLKGKSVAAAIRPLQRRIKAMSTPWDIWFEFGLKEEKNEQGKWFSLTAQPFTDDKNPQFVPLTDVEKHVCNALSRQIINEVYLPKLESVYRGAKPVAEQAANMDSMIANSEPGADSSAAASNI